ncbi:similar to Putative prophage transmembrane protein [Candidatus Glomeribacter gigasporarum BEG34]|uniref:Similar to Putative prophage transmembrane protein n=1 Tax=Candidatus Glomeribacter gigasporarum BEG34 TaxID=1070319 RepID=G2JAY5_9BURK|nr:hypothetical protein [Candidatus Glomeribacter gigasporarum]CCD29937.1 similar to Putative prophage transmembrane protein [Candidatus Glomeribacter gigasporarum BEG34]
MFEAYKIGIRISLINHAASGLLGLSRQFMRAEQSARELEARILSIKHQALKGGLSLGVGVAGLSLFKGPLKDAMAYQNQLSNLNVLGMKQAEIAEVVGKAWQVSRDVVTSTATDNLKAYRELRSAFGAGHEHEALSVLPQVQMASSILEAVSGQKQAHVGFDMVKAIEIGTKGAISTNAIQRQAEMMTQAIVGMGGTVTVSDFHQALKYARTAAPYLSEEFKYNYLPTLIQEMKSGRGGSQGGASGAGNMIASLYGMIADRMIPKDLMQNWVDAGLVKRGMMVPNKPHTGTAKILPGGIKGSDVFAQNPLAWANTYAAPAIQRLMRTKHLSEVDAYYALTKNRIAAFGLQTLVNKAQQFERDRILIERASGIDAYRQLTRTNPQLATQALHTQWKNLKTQVGIAPLPETLAGLHGLTETLKKLNAWAEKNTGTVKGLSIAFTVLSGALAFRDTVLLLADAFRVLGAAMLWSGLGVFKGGRVGASILGKAAKSRPVRFIGKHLIKAPLASILKPFSWAGGKFITLSRGIARASGAWFARAMKAIRTSKPAALLAQVFSGVFGKLRGVFGKLRGVFGGVLGRFMMPALTWIGRILMIGLRAIPIIGWVVMAVTLGLWLWRNWDVIWKKVKAIGTWASKMIVGIGTWASKMIVGAWVWVKKKIGPLWTVLKSALGRALKTFIWWFLDQWQFLFNTILSGINKILPKAWELKRLSFADQYRARHLPDKQSRHIAPRAVQTVQVHSVINLKDQAIAKVVTTHQARAANRSGTGASLFDPTMGVLPIGMA